MKTRPSASEDRELLRLLSGELSPADALRLRQRIAADESLRGSYERLAGSWRGLELPPPTPVPAGYAERLTVRATTEISLAPLLARRRRWPWGALLALAAGLLLGAGLGKWRQELTSRSASEAGWYETGLAEPYWQELGDDGEGR